MKVVYEAANLIDAHLVRHALEAADIPVHVSGEALVGGVGELPMFGLVAVCVPASAWTQARAVVKALALGEAPDSQAGRQIDGVGEADGAGLPQPA